MAKEKTNSTYAVLFCTHAGYWMQLDDFFICLCRIQSMRISSFVSYSAPSECKVSNLQIRHNYYMTGSISVNYHTLFAWFSESYHFLTENIYSLICDFHKFVSVLRLTVVWAFIVYTVQIYQYWSNKRNCTYVINNFANLKQVNIYLCSEIETSK